MDQQTLKLITYYAEGALRWRWGVGNRAKGAAIGWVDGAYLRAKIRGKTYLVHRLVFLYFEGYLPDEVDHINGVTLDNNPTNLRAATHGENTRNAKPRSNTTSGVKGITFHAPSNKWKVRLNVDKRQLYLGLYEDLELAALVVAEARKLWHKAFARQV